MPIVKIVKKSASTANPLAMPSTEKQLQRAELSGMRGAEKEQKKAEKAALSTAKYLWNFLSGMADKHNLQAAA